MEFSGRDNTIGHILTESNEPSYRRGQIFGAIYKNHIKKYDEITTIPKELRVKLIDNLGQNVSVLKPVNQVSDNQAQKVLFETRDGERIEAVLTSFAANNIRPADYGSLCISSQAGCAMGCKFCATGTIGFRKNLVADELVDQILYFLRQGNKIDSVSFMGMGEPLVNPHLFKALEIMTDKEKLGFSQRRISISTVGVIPGIKRLQKEFPSVNLGFSLHSPFPEQRLRLMPITASYPIADVMLALKNYVELTNKRVLIAYVMLANVNDSLGHAKALARLIKNQGAKSYLFEIKLIRFNPGPTKENYSASSNTIIRAFQKVLDDFGIKNTLRQNFGIGISAACGQLSAGYINNIQLPSSVL